MRRAKPLAQMGNAEGHGPPDAPREVDDGTERPRRNGHQVLDTGIEVVGNLDVNVTERGDGRRWLSDLHERIRPETADDRDRAKGGHRPDEHAGYRQGDAAPRPEEGMRRGADDVSEG